MRALSDNELRKDESLAKLATDIRLKHSILETKLTSKNYPVSIHASRYGGAYEGGSWVLIADHYKPRDLDAFGSDTDCMEFWGEVRENGPRIEWDGDSLIAFAGSSPDDVYQKYRDWMIEESKQAVEHEQNTKNTR